MSKITEIRLALSKILASFTAIPTDKETLVIPDDGVIAVDAEVYIEKDDVYEPAPDGEYTLQDGTVVTVVSGRVETMKGPEAAVEAEVAEEPIEEPVAPVEEQEPEPEVDPLADVNERIAGILETMAAIVVRLDNFEKELLVQRETLTKMSQMSAAMSAQIDIERSATVSTGNKQLDEKLKKMFPR